VDTPSFEGRNYDHCLLDVSVVRVWHLVLISGNNRREELNNILGNFYLYGDVQLASQLGPDASRAVFVGRSP
jgi:hypothetical protein